MTRDQKKTDILEHELAELQTQIAKLEKALEEKPEYGMGKGDPAITRWELDKALLENLQKRAARLEKTLAENTDYGVCERCGKPIHPDRLAVLPDARLCIECAQAGDAS